jgi:hypothetical protein
MNARTTCRRSPSRLTRGVSLLIAAGLAAIGQPALATDAEHPTVVELFQSQGCSSCPPAIANINAIADRRDVLALTFAVTYWDELGWKDTFAKPQFTARQWDYAHAAGRGRVATPQTIINGRAVTNGGDAVDLVATMRRVDRGTSGPSIALVAGKVMIGRGAATHPAIVWLVRYDPRPLSVPIRSGENGGRTLIHRNVVRSIAPIGTWRGQPISLPFAADQQLRSAALVQSGKGGPIIAAARL